MQFCHRFYLFLGIKKIHKLLQSEIISLSVILERKLTFNMKECRNFRSHAIHLLAQRGQRSMACGSMAVHRAAGHKTLEINTKSIKKGHMCDAEVQQVVVCREFTLSFLFYFH